MTTDHRPTTTDQTPAASDDRDNIVVKISIAVYRRDTGEQLEDVAEAIILATARMLGENGGTGIRFTNLDNQPVERLQYAFDTGARHAAFMREHEAMQRPFILKTRRELEAMSAAELQSLYASGRLKIVPDQPGAKDVDTYTKWLQHAHEPDPELDPQAHAAWQRERDRICHQSLDEMRALDRLSGNRLHFDSTPKPPNPFLDPRFNVSSTEGERRERRPLTYPPGFFGDTPPEIEHRRPPEWKRGDQAEEHDQPSTPPETTEREAPPEA